ncbi:MAG: response regulator, partial [Alcanivorax sp.]
MTNKLALVVDDSRMARHVLSKMLTEQGIDVDSVESGEEALGYLCDKKPSMIFMDHTMPGMDGFQCLRAIKNDPHTAMIPIIMYTSKEGEVYESQARALGAVDVLPKTLKPLTLAKVLERQNLLPHQALA